MTQLSPATLAVVRSLARIVYEDFRTAQRLAAERERALDTEPQRPITAKDGGLANTKSMTRQ